MRPDRRTVLTAMGGLAAIGAARGRGRDALASMLGSDAETAMASAGVIARRAGGTVALEGAVGEALTQDGPHPFSLDRPFRVASVSKLIATAGFLPLALRRGFDLDGDVSEALGFKLRHPAHPDRPISARMLLSHTSGLRNGPSYPVPLGHRLADAFLPEGRHFDAGGWFGPSEHRPGDWFAYADVNFALIAQILERLSGLRFDLYMDRNLFQPLGLDIGYNWSGVSQPKRALAVAGLRRVDGRWTTQVDGAVPPFPGIAANPASDTPGLGISDYQIGDNGFVFSPQGGLRLGLQDMDRLAQMFARRGQGIVDAAALDLLQRPAWTYDPDRPNGETDGGLLQGYGLGCHVPLGRPGPGGDAFFGADSGDWRGHFGDAYGWFTGLFWNRRDARTLVYAVNGMPETDRPPGLRSSVTAPEEKLIDLAMAAIAGA